MSGKRIFVLMVAVLTVLFVVAACGEEEIPTQEPVEFHPTAADAVEREDSEPEAPAPEVEESASSGDAGAGQNLFVSCAGCHATDESKVVGPGLGGIYDRAGSRTSLDADAYLEQSIRQPGEFVVDGFPAVMPGFDYLSEDDVLNLIAYLKTLN